MNDRVRLAEQPPRLEREQLRIAGAGADEIDGAGRGKIIGEFGHGWSTQRLEAERAGGVRAGEAEGERGEFGERFPDGFAIGAELERGRAAPHRANRCQ